MKCLSSATTEWSSWTDLKVRHEPEWRLDRIVRKERDFDGRKKKARYGRFAFAFVTSVDEKFAK